MLEHQNSKASTGAATATVTAPANVAALPAGCLSVPVRRIVTFHLNGLGDLLFTLPALSALRESFPGARITSVVRPALAPLLQDSPFVDDILLRPKGGLSSQAALMAKLHGTHFDLAMAFSQSRNTTLLVWSTGAAVRAGFHGAKMEALLTHRVPKEGPPRIETHLELVRAVGCATHHLDYNGLLHIGVEATSRAQELLDDAGIIGPFLIAACAASDKRGIKEWPAQHWVSALKVLSARWPVVLVGTEPTHEVTSQLNGNVWDFGGRTDLPSLAALCGKSALFCGIDSGVLHLAAAMQTPVVGIYGPSDWRLTGPRGVSHRVVRHPVECSPCMLAKCKWEGEDERKCLTRLHPNQLVTAIHELLGV
ncbi:MAG: heptosyltransferase [Abditibacteriota bacterium]|nr:heptosyltransferase [Abditibacteriota bacterium]